MKPADSALPPLKIPTEDFLTFCAQDSSLPAAAHEQFLLQKARHIELVWDTRDPALQHISELTLFFSIPGQNFDPTNQLKQLHSRGAWIVCDARSAMTAFGSADVKRVLSAPDPQSLLKGLSQAILKPLNQKVRSHGITGTNGKTSTTQILAQLLRSKLKVPVATIGTLGFFDGQQSFSNSFPTTPNCPAFAQMVQHLETQGVTELVMEVSSHALVENRLGDWIFESCVLTNITPDHLDFHKTMTAYENAKLSLFQNHAQAKTLRVISTQQAPWQRLQPEMGAENWVLVSPHNHQSPVKEQLGEYWRQAKLLNSDQPLCTTEGLEFDLICEKGFGPANAKVHLHCPQLFGFFQVENLMLAVAVAELCFPPVSIQDLCGRVKGLEPIPGRLQRVLPLENLNKPVVFVDYAHTPDALSQALRSLRELRPHKSGRLITVFGCGGDRDREKRPLMGRAAADGSDGIIITSDNPRTEDPEKIIEEVAKGCGNFKPLHCIVDRGKAVKKAISLCSSEDVVLIAGKGHEDYQIIGHNRLAFSDVEFASRVLKE